MRISTISPPSVISDEIFSLYQVMLYNFFKKKPVKTYNSNKIEIKIKLTISCTAQLNKLSSLKINKIIKAI